MAFEENEIPVRIIKKKRGHAGHHGGAWKVAYADFVTAMMALFIVLWIVGQSKQVKQYVANYFKDPGAFQTNTKGGGAFDNDGGLIGHQTAEEMLKRQQEKLQALGETIKKELQKKPELKKLSEQISVEMVKEGMRIELLEKSQSFFFDIGTANLKPAAEEILRVLAEGIGPLPNHIIVEGHTDSRKYARADGYTNFELSSERANSARRALVKFGVKESQVDEVRGYADTQLRNASDPLDETNRRISIIIKYEKS